MAISLTEILFQVAEEVGKTKGDFITTATDTTHVTVTKLATTANTYRYALARILGKGLTTVTAQDAAGAFTVSPAFTSLPVVGEVFALAWWNGKEQNAAIEAVNESILISYPYWYDETVINQAAATITLAASNDVYTLPTDVDALIAVGIQIDATRPIRWQGPYTKKSKVWSVEGESGAYSVRFHPRYSRTGYPEMYSGLKLCLWYASRAARLTSMSNTTKLPLEYFTVAAEVFRRRQLNDANRRDLMTASVNLPQLQQVAQQEIQRLQIGKRPPNLVLLEPQSDNALEVGLAMGMTAEQIMAAQPPPQRRK